MKELFWFDHVLDVVKQLSWGAPALLGIKGLLDDPRSGVWWLVALAWWLFFQAIALLMLKIKHDYEGSG